VVAAPARSPTDPLPAAAETQRTCSCGRHRSPPVIGLFWGVVGVLVGSVRERSGGYDPVHALLRTGREVFADLAAAMASEEAAFECFFATKRYLEVYDKPSYALPATPGLEDLVELCGRQGCGDKNGFYGSVDVLARRLAETGNPGAEYFGKLRGVYGAYLKFSYDQGQGSLDDSVALELWLYYGPVEKNLSLVLSLFARALSGSRLTVSARWLLGQASDLIAMARALKMKSESMLPPVVDLAAWLASRSKEKWGDTAARAAAEVATTLLSVTGAALHEVQRASRIQAAGPEYSAIAEAAEEARSRALEAYSTIAEKAASGQGLSPFDLLRITIWGRVSALDTLEKAAERAAEPGKVGRYIRYVRAKAMAWLVNAIQKAAGMRAAAEVLASLSDPG